MKTIPVLGIPFYNRADLLQRCVASIDYPVDTLVVIQNGEEDATPALYPANYLNVSREFELIRRVVRIKHPNAGVAGAWNEIIKLFPADWWMLVNNDIQFAPGDLQKMAESAAANPERASLFGNHGHSFFIITARGVETVGLFDENIYPAYLEDCDWMYRLKLAGQVYLDVSGVAAIHGDEKSTGSCTIHSDPIARENNHRTHGNNFSYYVAKWGGINGQEKYPTPFDQPGWPVWLWNFSPLIRRNQQWR